MSGSKRKFDAREFRDALSSFATGVTIVTACESDGSPVGMTASSFNSVSTEPPLVLWSVTKTALSAPVFRAATHFAIHVLATDQTELSNRFAKSGADKFAGTRFSLDANGVPILEDTAARFDCTTWAVYEGGDHWIIVGEVSAIEGAGKEGLVFGGGSYATAAPLTMMRREQEQNGSNGLIENMLFYHLSRAYHQMSHQFHDAVIKSGMTVEEWRISASLFGKAAYSLSELANRTFLDPELLRDIVASMAEDDLCELSGAGDQLTITGTASGHQRVTHLFALAGEQEKRALSLVDEELATGLKTALSQLAGATRSSD